jgi:CelD/BcsL family acetyltransferase involved in cellulose biosynthesis
MRSAEESTDLTIQIVTTMEELLAVQSDYERLHRATGNTLPFALHDWHVEWCNQFLYAERQTNIRPMIHVVRNREQACVAIVPLILTLRTLGPLTVASVDLLGADPAITEIRTPLVERGYETRVAWLVQRSLAKLPSLDWVQWRGIGGAFEEALAVGAELQWQDPLLSYVLDLPPTWDLLRARLKRNIRESIRHCYNSLARDGLKFNFHVVDAPHAVDEALQRFFALHALRANQSGTVAHPNHFASEVSRRFLRQLCARFARRGALRLFQLAIGEEIVAVRIGFVVGNSLYLYYSGYDTRWSKYGVMTTTLVEAIKYAISQGYSSANLSPGKDVSKTRWGPREIAFTNATQVAPSKLSRLAWRLYLRARSRRFPFTHLTGLSRLTRRSWI